MSSVLPTRSNRPQASYDHPGFFHLHRRTEPVTRQRIRSLIFSYAPDWLLTLVVTGLFFLLDKVTGFKREFSLTDVSLQHTFAVHERVPNSALALIAVVAPLLLMAIINLISIRSFWDLHTSWLGAILGLGITGSITNVVKITVGRPRPDIIDRCQPRPGSVDHPVFGLVTATICTQTDSAILEDGFRSFFSGHSSLSFAGLGFLAFYLAGKLHLFDERGHTAKAWISVVPLIGAALVAISRTMDNRHHWQDVLTGSLLGLIFSWFSYRQYYPPLSHPLSHRPYSPRISGKRPPLPHIRIIEDDPQPRESAEVENLSSRRYSEQGEELEMQRSSHENSGSPGGEDPPSLRDVWKQGEGMDVVPPERSRPPSTHDNIV